MIKILHQMAMRPYLFPNCASYCGFADRKMLFFNNRELGVEDKTLRDASLF